jgi:hypothetical protein
LEALLSLEQSLSFGLELILAVSFKSRFFLHFVHRKLWLESSSVVAHSFQSHGLFEAVQIGLEFTQVSMGLVDSLVYLLEETHVDLLTLGGLSCLLKLACYLRVAYQVLREVVYDPRAEG